VPAEPIQGVIDRMEAIAAELPPDDGVARFNHLYLAVTRGVLAAGAGTFEDPRFLSRLDVVFADLYFAAVGANDANRDAAWDPLFEARRRADVAPIQFALAGMNAHINFDLCLALIDVSRELSLDLDTDSPQHRDYERVNGILEQVEAQVKADYMTGLVGVADEALGRIDDVVAMWSVERARDAGWTHAQALSALGDESMLAEAYRETRGEMVGFAGRGLLVPTL
jgi:hypothetical protein